MNVFTPSVRLTCQVQGLTCMIDFWEFVIDLYPITYLYIRFRFGCRPREASRLKAKTHEAEAITHEAEAETTTHEAEAEARFFGLEAEARPRGLASLVQGGIHCTEAHSHILSKTDLVVHEGLSESKSCHDDFLLPVPTSQFNVSTDLRFDVSVVSDFLRSAAVQLVTPSYMLPHLVTLRFRLSISLHQTCRFIL